MTSVKLDSLPLETLEQVASYLNDAHRPSLYAFSLASKACHRAALRSVFRDIHLIVYDCDGLKRDVDALVKVLHRVGSAHYVRHLGIKGFLLVGVDEYNEMGQAARTAHNRAIDWSMFKSTNDVLGDEEPCLYEGFWNEETMKVAHEESIAWTPVVNLVEALPRLSKLVYDCRNQFPPGLLDAIHKHHPQCKVHHLNFGLRSLGRRNPDLHEMAIATSPCLHSVTARYARKNSRGDQDFTLEAMLELVAGLAPNLKEVRMIKQQPVTTLLALRRGEVPQEVWQGLPGFVPGRGMGSLTSLSLQGVLNFGPDSFNAWNKHTDFSCLCRLELGGGFGCYSGVNEEAMEWIVQNCSFPRLKALHIRLNGSEYDYGRLNYARKTIAFFDALETLDELSVSGSLDSAILDGILSRHGRTLRKLSLRPSEDERSSHRRHIPIVFEKEHVAQIQAHCPVLQDLAFTIKRTKSDAREAEIYRGFSKMERLQILFLTLDCSDWRVTRDPALTDDPSFDEDDRKLYYSEGNDDPTLGRIDLILNSRLKRGHVRETFMNCAVDETLARSIWETIYQDKRGKQLKSLKLYTAGGGRFGEETYDRDISEVAENLSRWWLIEHVRDDDDIITVTELSQRSREARDKRQAEYADEDYGWKLGGKALNIFRRIWASKEGSKDWREDWASLPLRG